MALIWSALLAEFALAFAAASALAWWVRRPRARDGARCAAPPRCAR
ncbi:hypothetical protein ACL03H_03510 [Saccharopolyspora sp. MS10]